MITKQALGSLLFGMADILRDKVEDYKSYILSLLFFKRLSDNYQWEGENARQAFLRDNGREPSARELEVINKKMHDFVILYIRKLLLLIMLIIERYYQN